MKPNARSLALRDAAAAAYFGVIGQDGADFGVEFGDDYGTEFGAEGGGPAAWSETRKREALLEPNKGSRAKIQRYTFGVSQDLTLGTTATLAMSDNPETHIRPQRVTSNSPCPAFCTLSAIKVANVGVIVGGVIDAFDVAAVAVDAALDVPTLSPANKVNVAGTYSGLLPTGYVNGATFKKTISFKGPASMVA